MAGKSQRFFDAGYTAPKALLPIGKEPMIEAVLNNLAYDDAEYTIIINKNQITKEQLGLGNINIIEIDYVPTGPACSAALASEFINNDIPLIVTNCDQIIEDLNIENFIEYCDYNKLDGCLGTFHSTSNKNSYVQVDDNNVITKLREKEVISSIATNGFHYWKRGKDFINSVEQMIANKDTVNSEYYISTSYNYLISSGMKLMPYAFNLHFPIGTPTDYETYVKRISIKNDNI